MAFERRLRLPCAHPLTRGWIGWHHTAISLAVCRVVAFALLLCDTRIFCLTVSIRVAIDDCDIWGNVFDLGALVTFGNYSPKQCQRAETFQRFPHVLETSIM